MPSSKQDQTTQKGEEVMSRSLLFSKRKGKTVVIPKMSTPIPYPVSVNAMLNSSKTGIIRQK
jgi:hypothetical protein